MVPSSCGLAPVSRVVESHFVAGFALVAIQQGRRLHHVAWNPQPSITATGEELTWCYELDYTEEEQALVRLLAELKDTSRNTSAPARRHLRLALKVSGRLVQRELRLWSAGMAACTRLPGESHNLCPSLGVQNLAMSLTGCFMESWHYLDRLTKRLAEVWLTPAKWEAIQAIAHELRIHPTGKVSGEQVREYCRDAGLIG